MDISILSLCSGVGWLDLGVECAVEHLGGRSGTLQECEQQVRDLNARLNAERKAYKEVRHGKA